MRNVESSQNLLSPQRETEGKHTPWDEIMCLLCRNHFFLDVPFILSFFSVLDSKTRSLL